MELIVLGNDWALISASSHRDAWVEGNDTLFDREPSLIG